MKNNEKGFTLIEMMIVLLVISVLLIITVPNVTKHNANINSKGCEAYVSMVQGQVQAFQIDKGRFPANTKELAVEGYLKSGQTNCPDGKVIAIDSSGLVTVTEE